MIRGGHPGHPGSDCETRPHADGPLIASGVWATCAVVVVATVACGGDSRPTTPVSPTAPSPQPQIPNVAGTYQWTADDHRRDSTGAR